MSNCLGFLYRVVLPLVDVSLCRLDSNSACIEVWSVGHIELSNIDDDDDDLNR